MEANTRTCLFIQQQYKLFDDSYRRQAIFKYSHVLDKMSSGILRKFWYYLLGLFIRRSLPYWRQTPYSSITLSTQNFTLSVLINSYLCSTEVCFIKNLIIICWYEINIMKFGTEVNWRTIKYYVLETEKLKSI